MFHEKIGLKNSRLGQLFLVTSIYSRGLTRKLEPRSRYTQTHTSHMMTCVYYMVLLLLLASRVQCPRTRVAHQHLCRFVRSHTSAAVPWPSASSPAAAACALSSLAPRTGTAHLYSPKIGSIAGATAVYIAVVGFLCPGKSVHPVLVAAAASSTTHTAGIAGFVSAACISGPAGTVHIRTPLHW